MVTEAVRRLAVRANEFELTHLVNLLAFYETWQPDASQHVSRAPIIRALLELLTLINGLPASQGVSEFEFVIGYKPLDAGLLTPDDEATVRRWHYFKSEAGRQATEESEISSDTLAEINALINELAEFVSRRVRFLELTKRE